MTKETISATSTVVKMMWSLIAGSGLNRGTLRKNGALDWSGKVARSDNSTPDTSPPSCTTTTQSFPTIDFLGPTAGCLFPLLLFVSNFLSASHCFRLPARALKDPFEHRPVGLHRLRDEVDAPVLIALGEDDLVRLQDPQVVPHRGIVQVQRLRELLRVLRLVPQVEEYERPRSRSGA